MTLEEVMKGLEALEIEMGQLQWTQFTTGYDFGMAAVNEALMAYLKDEGHFAVVKKAVEEAGTDEEKRVAAIALKAFDPYHKSDEINALNLAIKNKVNELMKVLNTFRFKLEGKEVTSLELTQILMNDGDRARRKAAYLARNQVNGPMVEGGFLELIAMRKKLAELSGFEDFVALKLHREELEPAIFANWKEELHKMLPEMKAIRASYAQKYLGDDVLYPWDEAYISAQIAPALNKEVDMSRFYEVVKGYFGKFGFDLDNYGIVYDVFPRKNKSEWGYFFPIETGKDARILANVKDRFHEYNVLLHETGHGVHHSLQKKEETILNRGISGIIEEGIANLFGNQIYGEAFFGQFFEEDLPTVKASFAAYRKWAKINAVRAIGLIMFDQNFYRTELSGIEDIHDMYWATMADYFGEEAGDYAPPWAFKIHHTSHPIYLHNYFMGDVTGNMLQSVFEAKYQVRDITEKPEAFGQFLYEEVIKPSGRYTYGDLFRRISGEDFSFKYLGSAD